MERKRFQKPRGKRLGKSFGSVLGAAALGTALLCASAGSASANTANPITSEAFYSVNANGTVNAWVTGTWTWGPEAVKNSPQSCKNVTAQGDVKGHYAVGMAVDWNDATTPFTLATKPAPGAKGAPATVFHVGSKMDWYVVDYCPGGSNPTTYPSGSFTTAATPHLYANLATFLADTSNGQICVNMYDIHQQNSANDWNPAKNGDNSIESNEFVNAVNCVTAHVAQSSTTPAPAPGLRIVKLQRIGSAAFRHSAIAAAVGQTVDYKIIVSNTGNASLNIAMSDGRCDTGTLAPSGTQTIAAGGALVYTCSHFLVSSVGSRFRNVASVTGTTPQGNTVGPLRSSVVARVRHPALRVSTLPRAKPAHAVVKSATLTG